MREPYVCEWPRPEFDRDAISYAPLLAVMTPAAIAGTWAGSQALEYVDERRFKVVYKTILTVIAVALVVEAV